MPVVWVKKHPKHRVRFHRSPSCHQLVKKVARGEGHPVIAVDLDEVGYRPCRTCYPDSPRIDIRRPYCPTCDSRYACEHNGGIQIITRAGRKYWVWPDTYSMPFYRRRLVSS